MLGDYTINEVVRRLDDLKDSLDGYAKTSIHRPEWEERRTAVDQRLNAIETRVNSQTARVAQVASVVIALVALVLSFSRIG